LYVTNGFCIQDWNFLNIEIKKDNRDNLGMTHYSYAASGGVWILLEVYG